MKKILPLKKQNQGFVSIIVTIIIMIVLTLIVLGFAQLSRREQRSALDRQLSTQAFYAAESGAGTVRAAIVSGDIDVNDPSYTKRTDCNEAWPAGVTVNAALDPPTNIILITCVLYNAEPTSLEFNPIKSNRVSVVRITNDNVNSVQVYWQANSNGTALRPSSCCAFTPYDDWDSDTGVLRIMLIPRDDLGRDSFRANSFTGFLYPNGVNSQGQSGTTNFANGVGNSGAVVAGNCNASNTPYFCKVSINSTQNNGSGYVLALRSIYEESAVKICINQNSVDCTEPIKGGQVIVDATGKANDVLRRIETRFTLGTSPKNILPIGFVSLESLCKQITLDTLNAPFVGQDPSNCSF